MALLALLAECAIVHVVASMTTRADPRQGGLLIGRRAVTGVAVELSMRAVEGELRAPIVVEVPDLPVPRVVARLALRSEPALMDVVPLVAGDALALRVTESLGGMALLACDRSVFADQGKARLVVVEIRFLPTLRHMAFLAFAAFLAVVYVILFVAAVAIARRRLVVLILVTVRAFRRLVFADERETGLVMIEATLLPAALGMAISAGLAQIAFMCVVFLMTAKTGGRRLLEALALVASLALDLAMLGTQREARLAVIEPRQFPGVLAMAIAARIPQGALVDVVLAVATDAGCGRFVESRALVARRALDVAMLAAQRESGLAVIETRDLPIGFDVAVAAGRPKRALMLVVLLVARDACRLQLVAIEMPGMTGLAFRLAMLAA